MKTKEKVSHTPGPWNLIEMEGKDYASIQWNGRAICSVLTPWNRTAPNIDGRANARLIAAAPDLLAACKSMLKAVEPSYQERDVAMEAAAIMDMRAAIAKAEGR